MKQITVIITLLFCFSILLAQTIDSTIIDSTGTGEIGIGIDLSVIGIIAIAITIILGALAIIFGKKYLQVKGLIEQLIQLIVDSIKDNKIATQELNAILSLIRDIKQAINSK